MVVVAMVAEACACDAARFGGARRACVHAQLQ